MFNKNFYFTFFILIAFSVVFTYSGWPHEEYGDSELGGSTYADVKGKVWHSGVVNGRRIHIHGIVYSWEDDEKHAVGDYTLSLQVSMPQNNFNNTWWEPRFDEHTPVFLEDDFETGVRLDRNISFHAGLLDNIKAVEYKASATVRNQLGTARDKIKKPINERHEKEGLGDTWHVNPEQVNNNVSPATSGISLANSGQTFQPGDSLTLDIVTSEAFYDVSWYVHTPWDTSSSGTYQGYTYGGGTATTASLTYTYVSQWFHEYWGFCV